MSKEFQSKSEYFMSEEEEEREAQEIWDAYEKGELEPVENEEETLEIFRQAARNFFKKDKRITIRVSSADINYLKYYAKEQGMPYQTMIGSILHKFVLGKLEEKK